MVTRLNDQIAIVIILLILPHFVGRVEINFVVQLFQFLAFNGGQNLSHHLFRGKSFWDNLLLRLSLRRWTHVFLLDGVVFCVELFGF